jgi:hypothetical protein
MQILCDIDDPGTRRNLPNIGEPEPSTIAQSMNHRFRHIARIPQQDMQMRITAPLQFDRAKVGK